MAEDRAHTESRLESALPQYHSEPAELIGREGMVTVWDDLGRYVGCMGVNLWRHLLTVSGGAIYIDAPPSQDPAEGERSSEKVVATPPPESSGDLSAAAVECNGPRDCIGTERGCYHCDPEKFVAQGNASYVLDWLRQTEAPSNILRLQEIAVEQLGGYLGAIARQVL